jgi:hypothetical protein
MLVLIGDICASQAAASPTSPTRNRRVAVSRLNLHPDTRSRGTPLAGAAHCRIARHLPGTDKTSVSRLSPAGWYRPTNDGKTRFVKPRLRGNSRAMVAVTPKAGGI